ncbi:hypothetical protein BV898_20163, partial [Hypsibius exemplaris]
FSTRPRQNYGRQITIPQDSQTTPQYKICMNQTYPQASHGL